MDFSQSYSRRELLMGGYLSKNRGEGLERAYSMFKRLKERRSQPSRNHVWRRAADAGHCKRTDGKSQGADPG